MWYQALSLLPYLVVGYLLFRGPSVPPLDVKRGVSAAAGVLTLLRRTPHDLGAADVLGNGTYTRNNSNSLADLAAVLPDSRASPAQSLTTAPLPVPERARPSRRHLTRAEAHDLIHEPAQYAALVYCGPSETAKWLCGHHCDNLGNITVHATGGNHAAVPWWIVVNNGTHTIVAAAGTNPHSLASVTDDLDIRHSVPTEDEFPGAPAAGVTLHRGFYRTFRRLAAGVRAGVESSIGNESAPQILVAGHSLGGALGHLIAVHLQHTFPQAVVHARLFASPRVGNAHWADYVDATLPHRSLHVVNYNDMVPHLPLREWGFRHPAGELWISRPNGDGEDYIVCEGQEDDQCLASVEARPGGMGGFRQYLGLAVHLGGYAGVLVGRQSLCARGVAG